MKIFKIVLIFVFFSISSCLLAQSSTTGALGGGVVDPMGAAMPGVTITLASPTTGQMQTTVTDAQGRYGFALLAPGMYNVDFSMPGFNTSSAESVVVNVSEAPSLDAQLEPGTPEDRVPCRCRLSEARDICERYGGGQQNDHGSTADDPQPDAGALDVVRLRLPV